MSTSSRAVNQVRNWLRSVNISVAYSKNPDSHLTVIDSAGHAVEVVVADNVKARPGILVVSARIITGRRIQDAFALFALLTRSLGFGERRPVDRGEPPARKAHFSSAFEDVAFRHTELHRAPNPSSEQWARYETCIERAAWKFLRNNAALCRNAMYDIDDVMTFIRVWAINYMACEPEISSEQEARSNERIFAHNMRQRFGDLRSLLEKQGRNVFVGFDEAFLGQYGQTYDYDDLACWQTTPNGASSEPEKRTKASAPRPSLDDLLGGLGHERLVEVLLEAARNQRIHPDARREAVRRIHLHAAACGACAHLPASIRKRDE